MMTKRPLAALCLFLALCLMLAPCAVAADTDTTKQVSCPEFGFSMVVPSDMGAVVTREPAPKAEEMLGIVVYDGILFSEDYHHLTVTVRMIANYADPETSFSEIDFFKKYVYNNQQRILEDLNLTNRSAFAYICDNGKYICPQFNSIFLPFDPDFNTLSFVQYITVEHGNLYLIDFQVFGVQSFDDKVIESIIDSITFTEPVTVYADVANHWAKDAILRSMQLGLFSGTSETTFSPNDNTTRAQLVTALYRLAGSPEVGEAPFSDVKADAWYANAVAWAAENGIVQGSDGKFRPNDPLTREQLATILCRFSAYQGNDVTAEDALAGYTDSGKISSWAAVEMNWAVAQGLITGVTETTLSPATYTTRAQLATILMRYLDAN